MLTAPVYAQGLSELNQRLGYCDAQTGAAKRAPCFEQLAREALQTIEKKTQPGNVAQKDGNPHTHFIAKAKHNITREFKDPSSVQWRNLFISGDQMPVLCGELNGKNSYGAFVGFKRFYAAENPALQDIENAKNPEIMNKMWPSMCGKKVAIIEADGTARKLPSPETLEDTERARILRLKNKYEGVERATVKLKASIYPNVSSTQYSQYVQQLEAEISMVRVGAGGKYEESAIYNFDQALRAYKDAGRFWEANISKGSTRVEWFMEKYNVNPSETDLSAALAKAWEYADAYITNARLDLLKPEN